MWMPLVDIDVDMGMLTFASGSYKEGAVFDFEISDESETAFDNYVKEHKFEISRAKTMKAGDATWHRGFTMHQAPGNNFFGGKNLHLYLLQGVGGVFNATVCCKV